jgi:glucose/mannose-6-phosphate isomerase
MKKLDDIDFILKLQGGDRVIKSIDALDKQLDQSFNESQKISFPYFYKKIKNIVVCGMGGSRFPSLIIKELFKQEISVPIIINDDYYLPAFVNNQTLVILSSYSGTTEEVIENAKQALNKKAKITAITSGGEIAKLISQKKYPGYIFNPIYNPSNQPRIGFGYSVGGLLGILIKLGFLKISKTKILSVIKNISRLTSELKINSQSEKNPAKQLVSNLYLTYPYYVVAEFLTGWGNALANQTNETAKTISTFRVIPELNHHLMEGLKHPEDIKKIITFVFFYSNLYSSSIKKRFNITKEVVEKNKIKTIWFELKGKNKIEQVFYAMALGSYLTMYLSVLYQEDPAVIPYVDYFKKRLKEIPA